MVMSWVRILRVKASRSEAKKRARSRAGSNSVFEGFVPSMWSSRRVKSGFRPKGCAGLAVARKTAGAKMVIVGDWARLGENGSRDCPSGVMRVVRDRAKTYKRS